MPVKIAYLILAHGNPDQLWRLVSALPETCPVMIHYDRRTDDAVFTRAVELLNDRPKLRFVRRHKCWWGSFGIVQGTLSLIQELLASEVRFDYATLLSGSDYPIKSNHYIETFLDQHRDEEFIESFSLTEPNRWSNHEGYFKTPEKVLCRHLRFRSRVVRLPGLRKMPAGLLPYGGSQWWTLSRKAITYIARFIERTPEFVSFSRQAFIPDESFIQTIVSNSYLARRVAGDDLRLVIWNRPLPPYPAILTTRDLDLLLKSNKHFARKFDIETDGAVLDALNACNRRAETA